MEPVCGAWRGFNGDLRHRKRGGPTKWAEAVALVLMRRPQRPHVPRQQHLLAFESPFLNEVYACSTSGSKNPRAATRSRPAIQGVRKSDLVCAPLEKSPSARPAAAVAQQTTSRRLRRSLGSGIARGGRGARDTTRKAECRRAECWHDRVGAASMGWKWLRQPRNAPSFRRFSSRGEAKMACNRQRLTALPNEHARTSATITRCPAIW